MRVTSNSPNYSKICGHCNNLLKLFDSYGVLISVKRKEAECKILTETTVADGGRDTLKDRFTSYPLFADSSH